MPILMGQYEMDALARKLAGMRYGRAKAHVRRLDKKGRLDLFRVVVGFDQWHTRYTLPSLGLRITLIEKREEYGQPDWRGYRRTRFKYLEARVEPIPEKILERMQEKAEAAALA